MDNQDTFTSEQLAELELDLIDVLRGQGLIIEEIKLIGLKGHGYHATVFSVLINDVHHVLKVYREPKAFEREAKHLHRVIPKDRFLFVWRADENRFGYNFTVTEVPDGAEMTSADLTPEVANQMAAATLSLHALRSRHRVSLRALAISFEQFRPSVLAHAEAFPELEYADISGELDRAIALLTERADDLRVRRARTHGDLWWANVIVAHEGVYLVDWERLRNADFCEDLAKFRILFNINRPSDPVTLWGSEPPQFDRAEAFMEVLLSAYEKRYRNRDIRFRYGLYSLFYGLKFFADYYNEEKHATAEALAMLQDGRREFYRYCIPAEPAA